MSERSARVTESVREIETPGGIGRAHVSRPVGATGTVIVSHGAGGGLKALDLEVARESTLAHGWAFVLIEQPWLVAGRKVAGPPKTLDAAWVPMVQALMSGRGKLPRPLIVGGRSAGARVACRTAADLGAHGALLLSFPLHPPGQPHKSRAPELALAPDPSVIVQGSADPFGTREEFDGVMPPGTVLHEVKGTHSFPKGSRAALRSAVDDALERFMGMRQNT